MRTEQSNAKAVGGRFPLDPDALTQSQRDVHAEIVASRGAFPLPYRALLASPDVAKMVEALSTRLWAGHLSKDTLEAVFLVVARRFRCPHQWSRHEAKAREGGVSVECIRAIAIGLRPAGPAHIVVAVQVAKKLLSGHRVGSRLWAQAMHEFDAPGLADLCAFLGLASMVAMAINFQDDSLAQAEEEMQEQRRLHFSQ
jgi:4-carboxymuconolactone decarboxylase